MIRSRPRAFCARSATGGGSSRLLFGAMPRLYRLLFKLIREPAKFMGNIWRTQSELAETIGNVEQIRNQIAIVFVGKVRFGHSQECGMPTLGKEWYSGVNGTKRWATPARQLPGTWVVSLLSETDARQFLFV